mgnify:FL=1
MDDWVLAIVGFMGFVCIGSVAALFVYELGDMIKQALFKRKDHE